MSVSRQSRHAHLPAAGIQAREMCVLTNPADPEITGAPPKSADHPKYAWQSNPATFGMAQTVNGEGAYRQRSVYESPLCVDPDLRTTGYALIWSRYRGIEMLGRVTFVRCTADECLGCQAMCL